VERNKYMDESKKKPPGRKQNSQVSMNNMLIWLETYTKQYPNEKIDISKLSKMSGIKRYYWYYREGIKQKIDEINDIKYEDYNVKISTKNKKLLELPDINSLIENNYRNKTKLKEIVGGYFNTIQEFFDSACKAYELQKEHRKILKENEILKDKLVKEKREKEKYKKLADEYKEEIRTITVRSKEKVYRDEHNIEKNLIDITKHKRVEFTTESKELENLLDSIGK
jgi:hypothetical protein